jgi:hypothetical protein
MPLTKTERRSLTLGQLARRWGLSRDHARQLVLDGHLPGAFTIPSAGRYGAVLKIPLASIIQVESDWAVIFEKIRTARPKPPSRRNSDSGPALKHFPKLAASLGRGTESPEAAGG